MKMAKINNAGCPFFMGINEFFRLSLSHIFYGHIVFYRDQQDCILWSIDSVTGKIYDDRQEEPVADTIEEFWFRTYIEAQLWYLYARTFTNHTEIPKDPVLRKYAQFYAKDPVYEDFGKEN